MRSRRRCRFRAHPQTSRKMRVMLLPFYDGYLCMRLLLGFLALAPLALPQQMDDEFARLIKEWTTKPEFISPLVDHLPKSSTAPSPKDVLGYYAGAPKKLTYYA